MAQPQGIDVGGGLYHGQWLNFPVSLMRFTLVYDGRLPAAGKGNTRADLKHTMRVAFHEQLTELWQERRALKRALEYWNYKLKHRFTPLTGSSQSAAPFDQAEVIHVMEQLVRAINFQGRSKPHVSDISRRFDERTQRKMLDRMGTALQRGVLMPFARGPFVFVPLATKKLELTCNLDILFLRSEPPGALFPNSKGDLDNRLKVLFDALTMPAHPEQLPADASPAEGQDPFFCLLEDDKLITSFRVKSERLLDRGPDDVKLIIEVTVKTQRVNLVTMEIEGD